MKPENKRLLEKMFGENGRKLIGDIESTDPELAQLIEEIPIERIWARSGLPLREKSLITIASQIALERWDQVQLHMESFLHLGGTKKDLREICIHLAVYCGFPATLKGLKIIREL